MARRRSTIRGGIGYGLGGYLGVWLARVALFAFGVAFLAGWFVLSAAGVDWRVAFVLLLIAVALLAALIAYARDLSRLAEGWAVRHRAQRTGQPEWAVSLLPFEGVHYTWWDEDGIRAYDGSAGDERDLAARFREHCDPSSSSALAGRIVPGWSFSGVVFDTRGEAYRSEAQAIERYIGREGYLNRRREGRGRVIA